MDATDAPPSLQAATPRAIRAFRLPMVDLERIREAGGPLAEVDLTRMAEALIAAVEIDGKVVAYWPVWRAVHAEPLWVSEDARGNPAVIRGILEEVEKAMVEAGDPLIFAIIGEDDMLDSGRYAMRLGFERVPGDLFVLYRKPEGEGV